MKASQLEVHQAVKKIEIEKEKKNIEKKKEQEHEKELQACLASNKELQVLDDYEVEKDAANRSALIEEVIEESKNSGKPLTPSVIKLLQHLKGIFNLKHFYSFLSISKLSIIFFFC